MAGAGIEVRLDGEYQTIIDALQKASSPALAEIAHAGGLALQNVSKEAFRQQADPATGAKWAALKNPRGALAESPGSTEPVCAGKHAANRPRDIRVGKMSGMTRSA